ncbi:MAG: bifunctional DNA-formamidopyrimidine glycosylase/DNA-(apurinic or apyrimidinic site) lyase [Actinomycetia bacterium]|nr:bifunctional DNA-formamidopyrimidine glycosylase/DNA-(apurinic or apyrimidinic site) lyase [Actinomycetes bacterium]
MPELPEVETVRQGLAGHLVGRTIVVARAHHPRVARRHRAGGADLCTRLAGRTCVSVERRGKYLWVLFAAEGEAPADERDVLVAHLGMSGQFRVSGDLSGDLSDHPHLRFDAQLDDGRWLSFLDQRTFGGLALDHLGPDAAGRRAVPSSLAHIGADPFEPSFEPAQVAAAIRRRHSEIKRVLLDQSVVSGIGNIYADEALWMARVHPARSAHRLPAPTIRSVIDAATDVMAQALEQGGTSFDALYVNVNGESGYFERSLAVYGRQDEGCRRCGAPVRRLHFMNRSSFVCQRCQRPPRPGSNEMP